MKIETDTVKSMFGKTMGQRATFGNWEAHAKTKQEAKQLLEENILAVGKVDFSPRILTHKGKVLLLWREPIKAVFQSPGQVGGQLHYKIIDPSEALVMERLFGSTTDNIDYALMHFAQQAWEIGDEVPSFLPESMAGEFKSWVRFQTVYAKAKEYGCDDHEAHGISCGFNPAFCYNLSKVQDMLLGGCVVLSPAELELIEKECPVANHIATAWNKKQVGTKDVYVAWLSGHEPSDLEFHSDNATASAY
jgi:hypothetical protein